MLPTVVDVCALVAIMILGTNCALDARTTVLLAPMALCVVHVIVLPGMLHPIVRV